MKLLSKIIVLFCLLLGNCVGAEQFKVLVLPVDLFSVCENYYCFPEVSEVFAEDVISNFNKSGKIISPDLYEIRKKMAETTQLKSAAVSALNKYKTSNAIDFAALKMVSKSFGANSVLMISSLVDKRSLWEVLEISSAFDIINSYTLETNVVLTDNVNDIVMWSGKYKRILADSESRFWAKSSAQANSQLEKIRFYSRDIVSKNISQNVILRFFPKVLKSVTPKTPKKTDRTDFRPNPLGPVNAKPLDDDYGDIETEAIFNF